MDPNEEQKKIDKKRRKKKQWKEKSKIKITKQRKLAIEEKQNADKKYFAQYKRSPLFNLLSMPLDFNKISFGLEEDIKKNINVLHDSIMAEVKGRPKTKYETILISICREFLSYTGSSSQRAKLHFLCWYAARHFFTTETDEYTKEKNILIKDVFTANRFFDLALFFSAGSESFKTEVVIIVFAYGLHCARLETIAKTPKQWRNAALLLGMDCDDSLIDPIHFAYLNAAATGDQNLLPFVDSVECPLVSRPGAMLMMEKFFPKQYHNDEKNIKTDGYVPAKFCLSYLYFYGKGVDKDIDKAFELLIEARNQNDCSMADYLGAMFLNSLAQNHGDMVNANKWIKQYMPEEKDMVKTSDDFYRLSMNLWIQSGKKIIAGKILALSPDEENVIKNHFHFMSIPKDTPETISRNAVEVINQYAKKNNNNVEKICCCESCIKILEYLGKPKKKYSTPFSISTSPHLLLPPVDTNKSEIQEEIKEKNDSLIVLTPEMLGATKRVTLVMPDLTSDICSIPIEHFNKLFVNNNQFPLSSSLSLSRPDFQSRMTAKKGWEFLNTANLKDAMRLFECVDLTRTDTTTKKSILLGMIYCQSKTKNFRQALGCMEQLLADPQLCYDTAVIRARVRLAVTMRQYELALKIINENAGYYAGDVMQNTDEGFFMSGFFCLQQIICWENLGKHDPDALIENMKRTYADDSYIMSLVLRVEVDIRYQRGEYSNVLRLISQCIDSFHDKNHVYLIQSSIYIAQRKYKEALHSLSHVENRDKTLCHLCVCYIRTKDGLFATVFDEMADRVVKYGTPYPFSQLTTLFSCLLKQNDFSRLDQIRLFFSPFSVERSLLDIDILIHEKKLQEAEQELMKLNTVEFAYYAFEVSKRLAVCGSQKVQMLPAPEEKNSKGYVPSAEEFPELCYSHDFFSKNKTPWPFTKKEKQQEENKKFKPY